MKLDRVRGIREDQAPFVSLDFYGPTLNVEVEAQVIQDDDAPDGADFVDITKFSLAKFLTIEALDAWRSGPALARTFIQTLRAAADLAEAGVALYELREKSKE